MGDMQCCWQRGMQIMASVYGSNPAYCKVPLVCVMKMMRT